VKINTSDGSQIENQRAVIDISKADLYAAMNPKNRFPAVKAYRSGSQSHASMRRKNHRRKAKGPLLTVQSRLTARRDGAPNVTIHGKPLFINRIQKSSKFEYLPPKIGRRQKEGLFSSFV